MKRLSYFFVFISQSLFAQDWQWIRNDTITYQTWTSSITTDGFGNSYVSTAGGLTKFDDNGNRTWVSANNSSTISWSACYSNSRLYLTADSAGYLFVTQLDTSGNRYWSTPNGVGPGSVITADEYGFLYTTGGGGGLLTKLDTSGNFLWYRMEAASGNGICTDREGNVYITGLIYSVTTSIDSHPISALGSTDIFIAKYDSLGNCLWAKRAGGNYNGNLYKDAGNAIIADTMGNLYITGTYVDTADFGSFTLYSPSVNGNEIFLAKYDTSGNVIWVENASGLNNQDGMCIALDWEGNILIGGAYTPNTLFGSMQVGGWGNNDAYIAKYSPSGIFISVLTGGGSSGDENIKGICADGNGNIFVAGNFSIKSYFGNDSVVGLSGNSMFVGKIDFTTGIVQTEDEGDDFVLFPNPLTDIGTFEAHGTNQSFSLVICDQLGREVLRKVSTGNRLDFSTEGIASGMYYYSIVQDNEIVKTGKMVIE